MPDLTALALTCSLKPSPAPSSADLIATQLLEHLGEHDVGGSLVRLVDHHIAPGVETDMGGGDEWPAIRERVVAADILVVATPVWLGHMSSVAQRLLERLDAELAETREDGNPSMWGKVALVGVVGNEDGAHKVTADLYQGLNDIGFTIAGQGGAYWNGEAMQGVDYNDLDETPEAVASTLKSAAANAAHAARLLRDHPFPA